MMVDGGRWVYPLDTQRAMGIQKSSRAKSEDATIASCGAIMATAGGTLPGQARVRASLYVRTRTLTRDS